MRSIHWRIITVVLIILSSFITIRWCQHLNSKLDAVNNRLIKIEKVAEQYDK